MVAKKRKSKRQTLKDKYKIVKRVKQHHKRLKQGKLSGPHKKKEENRIPNEWPHKAELLEEIRAAKQKAEEAKQKAKEKRLETIVSIDKHCMKFSNSIIDE